MTFRAASSGGSGVTTSATTLTIPIPTGAAIGDAAVMVGMINYAAGLTSVSQGGWTALGPYTSSAGNYVYLWTKVLVSDDITAGNVVITWSAAAKTVGGMAVFNIGPQSSPFGTPTGGGTVSTSAPTVATSQANSDVFFVQSQTYSGPGQTPAVTFAAGTTTDSNPRTNAATGTNVGISLGHLVAASTGSYGGATMPGAAIATGWTSQAVALEIKNAAALGKLVVRRYNGSEWE